MKLLDIVRRQPHPEPWAEGEKIPWDDPAFSRRMLQEHLSQDHDAASRRFAIIDQHVDWIHRHVLDGQPTRILDLGCGPGLYTHRLAELGHTCTGIDFSPASIAYAQKRAEDAGLACTYRQQDIRKADYGGDYGLVMLIFGEFNVFRPAEARRILEKADLALKPTGHLLLEPHTFNAVRELGEAPSSWHAAESGLFSDKPYLCLQENVWNSEDNVAIQRYYVVDAKTSQVTRHSSSMQAYTDAQYRALLNTCGFDSVTFHASWGGNADVAESPLHVIHSQKQAARDDAAA